MRIISCGEGAHSSGFADVRGVNWSSQAPSVAEDVGEQEDAMPERVRTSDPSDANERPLTIHYSTSLS
jgi:hypothetical protein